MLRKLTQCKPPDGEDINLAQPMAKRSLRRNPQRRADDASSKRGETEGQARDRRFVRGPAGDDRRRWRIRVRHVSGVFDAGAVRRFDRWCLTEGESASVGVGFAGVQPSIAGEKGEINK